MAAQNKDPLVGKFFHTFDQQRDIDWQGEIIAKVEPGYYLVQLFSWVMGEKSDVHLVSINRMTQGPKPWSFYDDLETFQACGDLLAQKAFRRRTGAEKAAY